MPQGNCLASSAGGGAGVKTQLAAILRAIAVKQPNAFEFAGKEFVRQDENAAVLTLQELLYQHCYCRPFQGVLSDEPAGPSESLLQELSAANAGRAHWEKGWEVYQVDGSGCIMARKNGAGRTFWPGEFLTYEGPGVGPKAGSRVDVYFASESRGMQPGFYFAFGETLAEDQEHADLVRFYWNLSADGAVPLTARITRALNRFQVPFRFKCLSNRGSFGRMDAAVLFVKEHYFRITADLAAFIREEIADHLRPGTPLFTKQLAEGLGFAEDPADGGSFGMNRCRLLAEEIWKQSSMDEIAIAFQRRGTSLDLPYLNGGSIDQYELG